MTFVQFLSAFIGGTVEVLVPNQSFEGNLKAVSTSTMQLELPPTIYGPGEIVTIPLGVVDYVRVLV